MKICTLDVAMSNYCFLIICATICASQKVIRVAEDRYFQNIPSSSCYWNYYEEGTDWAYSVKNAESFTALSCAELCYQSAGCTGFEVKAKSNMYGKIFEKEAFAMPYNIGSKA